MQLLCLAHVGTQQAPKYLINNNLQPSQSLYVVEDHREKTLASKDLVFSLKSVVYVANLEICYLVY